ncbi:MAG: spore coat protein CotJB [Eubacteriales bacterium]
MDNYSCGKYRTNCHELKKKLAAIEFAIIETVLYLDAYPDSAPALEYYHKLREQREMLLHEYESKCGPMTMYGNKSGSSWQWISKPWPWEYDAN